MWVFCQHLFLLVSHALNKLLIRHSLMITGSLRALSYAVIACDRVRNVQVIPVYVAQVTCIRDVLHGAASTQALLVRVHVLWLTELQPTLIRIFKVIDPGKKSSQLSPIKLFVILCNVYMQRITYVPAL